MRSGESIEKHIKIGKESEKMAEISNNISLEQKKVQSNFLDILKKNDLDALYSMSEQDQVALAKLYPKEYIQLLEAGVKEQKISDIKLLSKIFPVLIEHGQAEKVWDNWGRFLKPNDSLRLIVDIAQAGQANKVFDFWSTKFNLKNLEHLNLLGNLALNGVTDEALDRINKDFDVISSDLSSGLLDELSSHGLADKLLSKFGPRFDIKNYNHAYFYKSLIDGGLGKKVLELMGQDIDLINPGDRTLVTALVRNGFAKEVLDRWGAQIIIDDARFTHLIISLAENGCANQMMNLWGSRIDVNNPGHLRFLRTLGNNGCASEVTNRWVKVLDTNNVKHHELISSLEEAEMHDSLESGVTYHLFVKAITTAISAQIRAKKKEITSNIDNKEIKENIGQFLGSLTSYPALKFFSLAIAEYGYLSPRITNFIRRFGAGDSLALELSKTGSQLKIMYLPSKVEGEDGSVTFINEIPNTSAETWKLAESLGIPTSPILGEKDLGKGNKRIYSRYSGMTIGFLSKFMPESFTETVEKQKREIISQLNHFGIVHGHAHDNNFTVEFVEKKSGQISFNPIEYFKKPEKYNIAVRLIDWDRSQSILDDKLNNSFIVADKNVSKS